MIRRCCAWSLLALALSPFTAPFATCDLQTLLGHHNTAGPIASAADAFGNMADAEALSVSPVVQRATVVEASVTTESAALLITLGDDVTPSHLTATRAAQRSYQRPYRAAASPILRL